jgi:hypothetical protein
MVLPLVGRVARPGAGHVLVVAAALMLVPSLARATPSTTYWAPSTRSCADGVTDYDVLHFMAHKSIPGGGYVAAGLYHGLGSAALFTNSEGGVARNGAMAGFLSGNEVQMKDVAYFVLILLLFALSWLYVKGLERL